MGEREPIPYRVWIGVTGHRDAAADPRLDARVGEILDRIRAQAAAAGFAEVRFGVVSALAEGPDQSVARAILREPDARLTAVLPMPVDHYRKTIGGGAALAEFDSLLALADNVRQVAPEESPADAYAAAGTAIIDHCDVLIAVLDARRPLKRGGTAAVVEEARQHRHSPLVHCIDPNRFELEFDERRLDLRGLRRIRRLNRAGDRVAVRSGWRQEIGGAAAAAGLDRGGVVDPLVDWLDPVFSRADGLAMRLRRREQRARLVLFLGAAIAVLLASLGLTYAPGNEALSISELVVLVILLGAVAAARWSRWHTDWLSYRALAENVRSMLFVNVTYGEGVVPMDRPPGRLPANRWVTHVCTELLGRAPGSSSSGLGDVAALRAFVEQGWLERQIEYYAVTEQRSRRAETVFTWLIAALFGVTCLAVLAHNAGAEDWHAGLGKLLVFLAIVIPGVGGAVAGLRDSAELQRHAARSRHMAQRLASLRWQLREAGSLAELQQVSVKIWQQLAGENAEWFDLMLFQELALHV